MPINKLIVQGRILTELKFNRANSMVDDMAFFTIAIPRPSVKLLAPKPPICLKCYAFNECAVSMYSKLRKGDNIIIAGHLSQKEYFDKDNYEHKMIIISVQEWGYAMYPREEQEKFIQKEVDKRINNMVEKGEIEWKVNSKT